MKVTSLILACVALALAVTSFVLSVVAVGRTRYR